MRAGCAFQILDKYFIKMYSLSKGLIIMAETSFFLGSGKQISQVYFKPEHGCFRNFSKHLLHLPLVIAICPVASQAWVDVRPLSEAGTLTMISHVCHFRTVCFIATSPVTWKPSQTSSVLMSSSWSRATPWRSSRDSKSRCTPRTWNCAARWAFLGLFHCWWASGIKLLELMC